MKKMKRKENEKSLGQEPCSCSAEDVAELNNAAELSEEEKARLEKAYAEACATVEQTEEMLGLHRQAYDEAIELLKERSAVLAETEKMLQNAKDAASEIAQMGVSDQETKTERANRLNDGTMVTVVCIAYKHEEFIAQALDSFLMQKTNFKFKVFVGEDCGPDGTAEIIRDYARRYPDIIIPFIREKNMGAQRNLIDLCQNATSPYIAFCEGDDYWVDEYKLQKQFDYMEAHPEMRVCCTQTEVVAPEDWHLRSWYKEMPDGRIILPDSTPGYERFETFSAAQILNINVAHTSTHFYRWNYDLEIPDWYYRGIIGDMPMLLMQMGNTKLGHIPEVTSAYRINESSAFFNKNREDHFLNTRKDMVRYLSGLREYAWKHFPGYPIVVIENRIKLESANYLRALIRKQENEKIAAFCVEYPAAARMALDTFIGFYWDQRSVTTQFGWGGYQLVARNRHFRKWIYPQVKVGLVLYRVSSKLKAFKRKVNTAVKQITGLALYWKNTRVPKDNNLWVFSGFNKQNYMDNSKYLYEYVVENHPEINAVWITLNKKIFDQLTEEGKPVVMAQTRKCRKLVSRAAVAFTDHFKMSDYDAMSGLNDKTKIVQLWHGVGLKTIGDLKNTKVPGVKFSDDILPSPEDTKGVRFKKKLLYWRYAYHRELFEKYFLLVCPGPERVLQIADPWHIPHENCFYSGHPRNILLHSDDQPHEGLRILYAPTYRWSVSEEKKLVNQIVESGSMIQEYLERLDGEIMIRLHPHTWRNYGAILDELAEEFDRIKIDHEKDIYTTLASYDILISDYSSIAYDFILLDRPTIYFNYDFQRFTSQECHLNYDYEEYSPGPKTATWEETLNAIEEYAKNPQKDSDWRCRIRDEFYDMASNDENNSERIVQEVKRRLEKA